MPYLLDSSKGPPHKNLLDLGIKESNPGGKIQGLVPGLRQELALYDLKKDLSEQKDLGAEQAPKLIKVKKIKSKRINASAMGRRSDLDKDPTWSAQAYHDPDYFRVRITDRIGFLGSEIA